MVFSRVSLPAVLDLSFLIPIIRKITSKRCTTTTRSMHPTNNSESNKYSTAGNDMQLKTRIVSISHLQCIEKINEIWMIDFFHINLQSFLIP